MVTADITPLAGKSHLVAARVQGTCRFYAAGFENGEAVIVKHDHGTTVLARAPFPIKPGEAHKLALTVVGDKLTLGVDGEDVVSATDAQFRYGQAGLRMASAGRMTVARLEVVEV
jgi:hypothetical protein